MANPLFTLSVYDLNWLSRARSAAEMAERIASLAARYGTTVQAVQDAVWGTGVVDGIGATSAAVRATAQSAARGAARRIVELGGRTVARQAARQVAAHGARTAGVGLVGSLGATVGTLLGVTVLVGVLAVGAYAARSAYVTYQQRQHADQEQPGPDRWRPGIRPTQVPSSPGSTRVRRPATSPRDHGNLYSPQSILGPHVDDHGREIPGARPNLDHGGHLEFDAAGRGQLPRR